MKKIIFVLLSFIICIDSMGQTSTINTESHDYKVVDGRMVVTLQVNGIEGYFLFDLGGRTAVLPEFAKKSSIEDFQSASFRDLSPYRSYEVSQKSTINSITMGNNVFANNATTLLLEGTAADYIRKQGLDGVVNGSFFVNTVLTIDKKNQRLYVSTPYKPEFIKLSNRTVAKMQQGYVPEFEIKVNGKPLIVLFDTWQKELLALKSTDQLGLKSTDALAASVSSIDYSDMDEKGQIVDKQQISLLDVRVSDQVITVNPLLDRSVLGLGLLDYGLLTLDFERNKLYYQSHESTQVTVKEKPPLLPVVPGKLNPIGKDEFMAYIFDYKSNKDFISKADRPVVIDFWASWCGPCLKLMPFMEKIAAEYKDQVIFYKIDADREKELCSRFNVSALPYMLFIKPGEAPIVEVGNQPSKIVDIIEKSLLK